MDDPPGFQEAAQQGAMARVGSRIGDYAITGIISEDETGVLYGGRHVAKARPVALKLLHERYTRDKATSEQLLAEAKATQPIRHGNVMDIADLGVTPDGDIFLEMDYLDGESLRSRLHQVQRLPPFEAINILRQTVRGLGAAHAAGVVHGGLRPDNVFLCKRAGRRRIVRRSKAKGMRYVVEVEEHFDLVKLLDFGVGRLLTPVAGGETGFTRALHYLSPEQAQGGNADQRSDMYSLGVVFYEMITGTIPFGGESLPDLLRALALGVVIPPSRRAPGTGIDARIDALIMRCLKKNPALRFATTAELLAALDGCITDCAFLRDAHRLPGIVESGIDLTEGLPQSRHEAAPPAEKPAAPAEKPAPAMAKPAAAAARTAMPIWQKGVAPPRAPGQPSVAPAAQPAAPVRVQEPRPEVAAEPPPATSADAPPDVAAAADPAAAVVTPPPEVVPASASTEPATPPPEVAPASASTEPAMPPPEVAPASASTEPAMPPPEVASASASTEPATPPPEVDPASTGPATPPPAAAAPAAAAPATAAAPEATPNDAVVASPSPASVVDDPAAEVRTPPPTMATAASDPAAEVPTPPPVATAAADAARPIAGAGERGEDIANNVTDRPEPRMHEVDERPRAPERARSAGLRALAALGLLVAVGVGIWIARRGSAPTAPSAAVATAPVAAAVVPAAPAAAPPAPTPPTVPSVASPAAPAPAPAAVAPPPAAAPAAPVAATPAKAAKSAAGHPAKVATPRGRPVRVSHVRRVVRGRSGAVAPAPASERENVPVAASTPEPEAQAAPAALPPPNADELLREAQRTRKRGHFAAAISKAEAALAADPTSAQSAQAYELIGICACAISDASAARAAAAHLVAGRRDIVKATCEEMGVTIE